MTAATANKDRKIQTGIPQIRRLLLEISANPYVGSAISPAADGYSHELVSGQPFQGFSREQIRTADAPAADGDLRLEVDGGIFVAEELPLTGVAQDDVAHKRLVYASDDNTFNMTGSGSLIGVVIGVAGTNLARVLCRSYEHQQTGGPFNGFETLADAAATLTTSQLDKLLLITPTTGRTLTLPPAADCTGRTFTIMTLAAFAITLDGDGSETINGATTNNTADAAYDKITIMSTGAAWLITDKIIA